MTRRTSAGARRVCPRCSLPPSGLVDPSCPWCDGAGTILVTVPEGARYSVAEVGRAVTLSATPDGPYEVERAELEEAGLVVPFAEDVLAGAMLRHPASRGLVDVDDHGPDRPGPPATVTPLSYALDLRARREA